MIATQEDKIPDLLSNMLESKQVLNFGVGGYSFTGAVLEQKLFYAYGTGSNGKSTAFEVIMHIFSNYSKATDFEIFLSKQKSDVHMLEVFGELKGVRYALASETESRGSFNENSDLSNRSLKVRDNRIHWALYNITSFITHYQKKQKINSNEETIDFRSFLFDDIREDIFIQLQALRAIRNITSHPAYDGEKEIGYLEAHNTETYLNIMQFIVLHFSNENIYKLKLKNILRAFDNNVMFLKNKNLRDQIETIQRNIYESESLKINKINFSSINLLKDINKIKKEIYIKMFNRKHSQDQILLTFEDSSEQRYLGYKGNSFGPKALDIIYEKAKKYINKHIITTSWGEWYPQQYFNDVYLLSLDEKTKF